MISVQQPQTILHGKAFACTEKNSTPRRVNRCACIWTASVLTPHVDSSLTVHIIYNYMMTQYFFPQDLHLIQCMSWMRTNRKDNCSARLVQFLATLSFSENLPKLMLPPELLVSHGIHHNDISHSLDQEWIYLVREENVLSSF